MAAGGYEVDGRLGMWSAGVVRTAGKQQLCIRDSKGCYWMYFAAEQIVRRCVVQSLTFTHRWDDAECSRRTHTSGVTEHSGFTHVQHWHVCNATQDSLLCCGKGSDWCRSLFEAMRGEPLTPICHHITPWIATGRLTDRGYRWGHADASADGQEQTAPPPVLWDQGPGNWESRRAAWQVKARAARKRDTPCNTHTRARHR